MSRFQLFFQASGYPIPAFHASKSGSWFGKNKASDINVLQAVCEAVHRRRHNPALVHG
jgi:hypothetical protein